MIALPRAIDRVLDVQRLTGKPLAIFLAGHNGSGKSTMWRRALADTLQLPLINADRMMLSILPEPGEGGLPPWATALRDTDRSWMAVAQQGVQDFVAQAQRAKVPFAMETVFSYWDPQPDGTVRSKIDMIHAAQSAGYFVLLVFVGLTDANLSVLRVSTRVSEGGHNVEEATLRKRFPKTQQAISFAAIEADATVMVDNSRAPAEAFTVARVQVGPEILFDIRNDSNAPILITGWLDIVAPRRG